MSDSIPYKFEVKGYAHESLEVKLYILTDLCIHIMVADKDELNNAELTLLDQMWSRAYDIRNSVIARKQADVTKASCEAIRYRGVQ